MLKCVKILEFIKRHISKQNKLTQRKDKLTPFSNEALLNPNTPTKIRVSKITATVTPMPIR